MVLCCGLLTLSSLLAFPYSYVWGDVAYAMTYVSPQRVVSDLRLGHAPVILLDHVSGVVSEPPVILNPHSYSGFPNTSSLPSSRVIIPKHFAWVTQPPYAISHHLRMTRNRLAVTCTSNGYISLDDLFTPLRLPAHIVERALNDVGLQGEGAGSGPQWIVGVVIPVTLTRKLPTLLDKEMIRWQNVATPWSAYDDWGGAYDLTPDYMRSINGRRASQLKAPKVFVDLLPTSDGDLELYTYAKGRFVYQLFRHTPNGVGFLLQASVPLAAKPLAVVPSLDYSSDGRFRHVVTADRRLVKLELRRKLGARPGIDPPTLDAKLSEVPGVQGVQGVVAGSELYVVMKDKLYLPAHGTFRTVERWPDAPHALTPAHRQAAQVARLIWEDRQPKPPLAQPAVPAQP